MDGQKNGLMDGVGMGPRWRVKSGWGKTTTPPPHEKAPCSERRTRAKNVEKI